MRGTQEASLGGLGITALVGSTAQGGDSYIVADYIHSAQILKDLKDIAGLDIREIYSRSNIDFFYRSNPDAPLDEFVSYWRDMVNVSFNSTTGNVTLQVFAFSAEDAKSVTDAILTVSEKLVNTLSEESRNQFVSVANQQVARAEDRLKQARNAITQLRQSEQAVDPTAVASMESSIIGELEKELATLKTRYKALVDTISKDAPSAKVLDRQIAALEAQLSEQRARVGSGSATKTARDGTESAGNNVSEVIDRFSELLVEQEFATKAYTASLASLEAAVQDAQKQERYFATYVQPRVPEIALYPERGMNTLLTLLAFTALWLIGYFVVRSVKDHAI
ncbi:hypothetical protein [Sinorhizobium sp. BG8]|uniref:hypothetical protein n=1 Tax=Sinorhizobium sp. BG8 TaxID=2613773 RepID=UPI00193E593A|nr:hypothetical protein [Sinorhizobium sp. BG8]QRM56521.1 hypothetical protein F3Y30_19770 [Sinorhizobium sp. BG8]